MGMTPRFIVLEGIDGVGKSTQAALLAERLGAALYRDGSNVTAEVRAAKSPNEILDLYIRGRNTLSLKILEELDASRSVVCDRWEPSTLAYQRVAGFPRHELLKRIAAMPPVLRPAMTLWLRMPVEKALARLRARDLPKHAMDRYETPEFLGKIEAEYRWLQYEQGLIPIDADRSAHDVLESLVRAVTGA